MRWDSDHAAEVKTLRDAASEGHSWAVDKLLSRPILTPEAEPFFAAWLMLSRDRARESISLGMAGGFSIPRPIPRDTITREGERLGHDGEALEDFTDTLIRIDDLFVEVEVTRAAADAKASADRSRRKR